MRWSTSTPVSGPRGTSCWSWRACTAPHSTRPSAGAPVSVPIGWAELDDPELRPDRWTVRAVLDRIEERGDPFRALLGIEQDLPEIS